MVHRVFLDTEFSGLGQRRPRLISLALVAEDEGIPPLYVETPSESWSEKATPWVMENVVPLLRGGESVVPLDEARARVLGWLEGLGAEIVVVTDCPEYDFAFLQAVLEPWPGIVAREAVKFGSNSMGPQYVEALKAARESFYASDMPEHNALADALALRRMWFAAKALGLLICT